MWKYFSDSGNIIKAVSAYGSMNSTKLLLLEP